MDLLRASIVQHVVGVSIDEDGRSVRSILSHRTFLSPVDENMLSILDDLDVALRGDRQQVRWDKGVDLDSRVVSKIELDNAGAGVGMQPVHAPRTLAIRPSRVVEKGDRLNGAVLGTIEKPCIVLVSEIQTFS